MRCRPPKLVAWLRQCAFVSSDKELLHLHYPTWGVRCIYSFGGWPSDSTPFKLMFNYFLKKNIFFSVFFFILLINAIFMVIYHCICFDLVCSISVVFIFFVFCIASPTSFFSWDFIRMSVLHVLVCLLHFIHLVRQCVTSVALNALLSLMGWAHIAPRSIC